MGDTVFGILIGIGLSAACGFRVFVPMLIASLAARFGYLDLAGGFAWISSTPAIVTFAVATALEIGAYYIPWLDNLLDTVATPAAVVAGTLLTASSVVEISPFLRWTLALVAGGGVAGIIQTGTVVTRAASSAATGGVGNPVVSSVEAGASIFLTVLALLLPVVAAVVVLVFVFYVLVRIVRRLRRQRRLQAVQ